MRRTPAAGSEYHYHAIGACLLKGASTHAASPLVGYAIDGYPIYGPLGPGGKPYTDADLDACHGHTSAVVLNGKTVAIYHYQATLQYPYTLGCYHAVPNVTVGPVPADARPGLARAQPTASASGTRVPRPPSATLAVAVKRW